MSLPKTWTECHEEVSRKGEAAPCDKQPVVGIRSDQTTGYGVDDPRSWYPVCKRHVYEPMVDLWRAFEWAVSPGVPIDEHDQQIRADAAADALDAAADEWSEWTTSLTIDSETGETFRQIHQHGLTPGDWLRARAAEIRKGTA